MLIQSISGVGVAVFRVHVEAPETLQLNES